MADLTPDEVMAKHAKDVHFKSVSACKGCGRNWPRDADIQAEARKTAEARVTALEAVVREVYELLDNHGYTAVYDLVGDILNVLPAVELVKEGE